MKATLCLVLLAFIAGSVIAQSPSPAPGSPSPPPAEASPSPGVEASPSPAAEVSPSPAVEESPIPVVESPALPAEEPPVPTVEQSPTPAVDESPAPIENVTDDRIMAYYSSPLFAIQNIPELAELAKLGRGTDAAQLLSDKKLVATIFAPNNKAVTTAMEFVQNATGADAGTLAEKGVAEQLLTYHVAKGAAVLLSRFTNNQKLRMLDNHTTTVLVEDGAGARRLMQGATYYIVSDTNQKIEISGPSNIQGGKSMIHVIDGVLVPQSLLDQFNITSTDGLPGAEPTTTTPEVVGTRDIAPTPETPKKSGSAGKAAAALLAVPALLAALLL